jgi:hypothetical protein
MREVKTQILTILAMLVGIVLGVACTKQEAKTITNAAIDGALAACVASNADLGDPELQAVCGFAEDLWPIVRPLVAGARQGARKLAAKHMLGPTDAGRD